MSTMCPTCHEISESLALRHAGLLDGVNPAELDEHLRNCTQCRAKAEQYSQLARSLQLLGKAIDFPDSVRPHAPVPVIAPVSSSRRYFYAAAAIAAMLLVFVGLIHQAATRSPQNPGTSAATPPRILLHPTIPPRATPPPVLFEYQRHLARGLDVEDLLDAQAAASHREATTAFTFNDSY